MRFCFANSLQSFFVRLPMSNFGVFQSSVMWRGENDKWFTRAKIKDRLLDNLDKFRLAVYQRWWVGAIYQRLSEYSFVPGRVSLYPIFACMIYLHWKAEKVDGASHYLFGSYSLEFGVYLHLPSFHTIYCCSSCTTNTRRSVFQVLVEKRKARNPFRRTAPYMLSCDLAFQLESALAVSILRSVELLPVSSFFLYRTSHLLIKLAGGLEYSWSIPFFFCDFCRFSQPDEESLIFSQRGLQNFLSSPDFFAGQVRISRAYWNGVFDLIPGTSWKYRPQNKGSSTKRLAETVITVYKSVNLGLSEVMEFSREMYYFFKSVDEQNPANQLVWLQGPCQLQQDFVHQRYIQWFEKGVKRMAVGILYVSIFGVPVSWCPAFLRAYFDVVGNSKKRFQKHRWWAGESCNPITE